MRARRISTRWTTGSSWRRSSSAGRFDFIFFADVVGLYGDYGGSYEKYVQAGLQIPSNDPQRDRLGIAYNTTDLGIAITSSVIQEHPFNFARKISTLDHASNGRIAWNIVTSALDNARPQLRLRRPGGARRALPLGRRVRRRRLQAVGGLLGRRRAAAGPGRADCTATSQDPQDQPRRQAVPGRGPAPGGPVAATHPDAVSGRLVDGGPRISRPATPRRSSSSRRDPSRPAS